MPSYAVTMCDLSHLKALLEPKWLKLKDDIIEDIIHVNSELA